MVYGARNWATRTFGDGGGALAIAVPAAPLVYLYGPGSYGSSSFGVAAYGGPAINTPGVIPPQVYTVNLVGALSVTGALGPKSQRVVAGTLTSSGTLVKALGKSVSGSISSAGTLTMRASDIRITGQVTPTGVLKKMVARSFSGASTPTGTDRNVDATGPDVLAGRVDLFGALDIHKLNRAPTLVGTLAPTAGLAKRAQKPFIANLFPHGSLSLGVQSPRGYAGAIAPQGSLMLTSPRGLTTLAQINMGGQVHFTVLRSLLGAAGSSGAIQKLNRHNLTATVASQGSLSTSGQRAVSNSSSIAPVGGQRADTQKSVLGTMAPAGTMVPTPARNLAGAIMPSGSLTLQGIAGTTPFLFGGGSITPRGRLSLGVAKNYSGQITPAGSLIPQYWEPTILVPGFVYSKYRRLPAAPAAPLDPTDPLTVANLILALTAENLSVGPVSSWADISGAGLTLAQSDATRQPDVVQNVYGTKKAVRFEAEPVDVLAGTVPLASEDFTMIWVLSLREAVYGGVAYPLTDTAGNLFSYTFHGTNAGGFPYSQTRLGQVFPSNTRRIYMPYRNTAGTGSPAAEVVDPANAAYDLSPMVLTFRARRFGAASTEWTVRKNGVETGTVTTTDGRDTNLPQPMEIGTDMGMDLGATYWYSTALDTPLMLAIEEFVGAAYGITIP